MSDLIADLYRQNEWANLRLIEVCRALPEDLLDATAVGSYGTIRDTLVHYVGGEQRYVRWLGGDLGGDLGIEPMRTGDAFPGFDYLIASVRASASALTALARSRPGSRVDRPGEKVDAEVILVQAINHGAEHRSQICTILTALGVTPPELDGWTWGEADGRIEYSEG